MGRPSSYKEEYAEQAYKLCQLGATDKQLSDFFGVSEVTLNAWKKKHPEFLKSLKESKDDLDAMVERSLFQRAIGYTGWEDKLVFNDGEPSAFRIDKLFAPDTTAQIFWLKNRQPEKWRDKQEVDLNLPTVKVTRKRFDGSD